METDKPTKPHSMNAIMFARKKSTENCVATAQSVCFSFLSFALVANNYLFDVKATVWL
jgi:hypothetical protein